MKVLLILEDPTLDQFIVKPIVERLFEVLRRTAQVYVLTDPHLSGTGDALDGAVLQAIVEDNPMIDLFLLVVDRDCDRGGNSTKLAAREQEIGSKLIGTLALEEVETWMLACQPRPTPAWRAIRAECDPKERYAEPYLIARGWSRHVGRGRKRAMAEHGGWFKRVMSRCAELRALRDRIASHSW